MNQETKVGLFLLAALAALLPSILFIGNIKLFQRTASYYSEFENVQALPPKAAVKVAGVEIGKVRKIKLIEGKARVQLDIDPSVDIHDDATASIGTTGIIGSRFVELNPGSAERPVLKPGSLITGTDGSGLNQMISKLTSLFETDQEYGNAVDNLKATLANIRNVSDSLNSALGEKKRELEEIVTNIRDLTENTKVFTRDLREIITERKEDVKVALGKFRDISDKLDGILDKIQKGEGTIGTLVSDDETASDVKEAITSIKDTANEAKKVLGRFTFIKTYWNYRYRYDFRDEESRSDVSIKFVPRKGKFYEIGVTNVGEPITNEKYLEYERKNRITATMGADWGPFTGYAGAIRSDGGLGLSFRPFWFNKTWERKVSLDLETADFQRDRTVRGRRLDSPWMAAGGRLALNRWLWIGARVEDILERSVFLANVNVVFRDEDLAYFFGFASLSR